MDSVANLGPEDVVYEPVLGDPAEAVERGGRHHGIEVLPVAGDLCAGTRNSGFDTLLELLRSRGHRPRLAIGVLRYTE